jgi:DNA-binding SARP family transcriptional activator/tetratricopeptide (TPR) repeat protein
VIRLLGPVEWIGADARETFGPIKQKLVVAALAVDAGRVVPWSTLTDRVWGDTPPAQPRRALYTYAYQIRRVLDALGGSPPRLAIKPAGYQLDIASHLVDVSLFRSFVASAHDHRRPAKQRAALLHEALSLWRGIPLSGLPGAWPDQVRAAWAAERVDAAVIWANTQLLAGRHHGVIDVVRKLLEQHPHAEPLLEVLLDALVADGRDAEALSVYADARNRLIEDLGAEPGQRLRNLHSAILRGQAAPAAAPTVPDPAAEPAPAQLPSDIAAFTGRDDELRALNNLLRHSLHRPNRAADPVLISVVSGTAGVGKTALAVHWAHRVRDHFPDGQLYINLRGYDPDAQPMDPAAAIRQFLDALQAHPHHQTADLDTLAGHLRTTLAGKRILILLDNARDASQVRPLLPGTPGCAVVITSRKLLNGLIAIDGAHALVLGPLTHADARTLLSARLGSDRTAAQPQAVDDIVARCGGLPLALAIVCGRATAGARSDLSDIASDLRQQDNRLSTLSDDDDPRADIRTVFSWSTRTLHPDAATVFRLLPIHPGPDVTVPTIASLTAIGTDQLQPLLTHLTRACLLTEPTPGRYAMHDLLRAFATEQLDAHEPPALRRAALRRLLDHYLHSAVTARQLIAPHRHLPVHLADPLPGVHPDRPPDLPRAVTWFVTEHPAVVDLIARAAAAQFDDEVIQLAAVYFTYFRRRGICDAGIATQQAALAAAHRLGDRSAQAYAHHRLGLLHSQLNQHDDASAHQRQALALFADLHDHFGQANAHLALSAALDGTDRHRQMLHHARRTLALYARTGDAVGQADALTTIGNCHAQLGDYRSAQRAYEQALHLHQQADDRFGQANDWNSIGRASQQLADVQHASHCLRNAAWLYRQLGVRYDEATTMVNLGDLHHAAGDHSAARAAWQHALTLLHAVHHPDAETVTTKLDRLPTRSTDAVAGAAGDPAAGQRRPARPAPRPSRVGVERADR